jgi:hypothetical protein
MTPVARTLGVFALGLFIAGCGLEHDGDDSVSKQFGSDYFGAGGSLNLTDPVAGDAMLAGGHVATAGEVKGDLIAVGGEVQVDAIVAGNARVAGGDVALGPATTIMGGLSLTGGRIRFEGNANEYLQASGAGVRIDGVVQGDAEVRAEEVDIGPNTRIDGKLVVHSPREPVLPEGAQIAGGLEFHQTDVGHYVGERESARDMRTVAHGVGSFLWMLGVFVAGTLFMLAFPAYSTRAAQWIGQEPLRSLGLGFVILVCLPVLVVLLLITIIGIPLALIVLMLYLLLLFLGWVTAAMFVGQKLFGLMRGGTVATTGWKLFALLLAVLGLWLVGMVPYIGGWVKFAALLLGIGALVWQGWPRRAASPQGAT